MASHYTMVVYIESSNIEEIMPIWTARKCAEFLLLNEGRIKQRMIEAAATIISDILSERERP